MRMSNWFRGLLCAMAIAALALGAPGAEKKAGGKKTAERAKARTPNAPKTGAKTGKKKKTAQPPPKYDTAAQAAVLEAWTKDHRAQVEQYVKEVDAVAAKGPFKPEWKSLEENYKVPEWYLDAKFGIFIHWGVYSVPGYGNEWYPRRMYENGSDVFKHHLATWGPQDKFGYKDFIPLFKAEKFDAGEWAELFKAAGAKFVVPVAEHHDGFQMYDSNLSDWCAAKMGPKKDIVGELAKAVRERGMILGVSSHRIEHWWFMDAGVTDYPSDVKDPKNAAFYGPAQPRREGGSGMPNQAYMENWLARTAELVDKYQPQLFWFDWWIEQPDMQPTLQKFAAFYYNRAAQWGKGVAINYKKEAFPAKAAVLDIERGQLAEIRPYFWQTDTAVGKNSWGYVKNMDYKTADSIVDDLIDIVSKNGALLLNIGPAPDGTIPEGDRKILTEIGRWLAVGGEAIYGTRPWKIYGEGPTQVVAGSFSDTKRKPFTGEDFRFTRKGGTIYAIALDWPGGQAAIKALAQGSPHVSGEVAAVKLLGGGAKLKFTRDEGGLKIELPQDKPCENAFAFEITGLKTVEP